MGDRTGVKLKAFAQQITTNHINAYTVQIFGAIMSAIPKPTIRLSF
jgi:hypothetical protein